MNYLLDTHTFIWWDSTSKRLSPTAYALLNDPNNRFFLSLVSVWEMQIKIQLGRLTLPNPLPQVITDQQNQNNVTLLGITLQHIYTVGTLPYHHNDPFDRLLIAQAVTENIAIVSIDVAFNLYPVKIIW